MCLSLLQIRCKLSSSGYWEEIPTPVLTLCLLSSAMCAWQEYFVSPSSPSPFKGWLCSNLMISLCVCVMLREHIMQYVQGITSLPHPLPFSTCFSCSAQSIYAYLNGHLDLIKKSLPVGFLTVDLHVWPDFHGNRSPLADLTLKGMVRKLVFAKG